MTAGARSALDVVAPEMTVKELRKASDLGFYDYEPVTLVNDGSMSETEFALAKKDFADYGPECVRLTKEEFWRRFHAGELQAKGLYVYWDGAAGSIRKNQCSPSWRPSKYGDFETRRGFLHASDVEAYMGFDGSAYAGQPERWHADKVQEAAVYRRRMLEPPHLDDMTLAAMSDAERESCLAERAAFLASQGFGAFPERAKAFEFKNAPVLPGASDSGEAPSG